MARFIERRWAPLPEVLLILGGGFLVPVLAIGLFLRLPERVNATAFVVILAGGLLALFVYVRWALSRRELVCEILPGKEGPALPADVEPEVFPEAITLRMLAVMTLAVACLWIGNAIRIQGGHPDLWPHHLIVGFGTLMVLSTWLAQYRLIVDRDEVRTFHPWLGIVPEKRISLAEIAVVESIPSGPVAIRGRDGTTIRYAACQPATTDRLRALLADRVARAKPRGPGLDDLL
ncbi:hypothetical protein [Aquisphaera insulae]|uniref:hypothetical protein n=1 Tax=Aquisphaera insulae TaxID=2712864 RepID=UPI0013ECC112|nr:hypothetical protein [Aquisphaera insulae]